MKNALRYMSRLTNIVVAVALSLAGCRGEATQYPYATTAELPRPFDTDRWERVETLGSTVGPFRGLGGHQMNAHAGGKRVRYTQGGSQLEKGLDFKEEVLLDRFENPQGDSLVVVYKRRPD